MRGVWKIAFFILYEINLSEGLHRSIIIFSRHTEGAVLLNIKWREAGTRLWQVCNWSWRMLSGGSARTRDQSDLRKRHIHFGRRNTTAEMAATRTLPPCRLSAGLVPVRLRQYFTYERISPQPPLVEPIEHLKKRDNCNVEQKGAPLPPKSGSITFLIFYEGGKGGCPAAGGKGGTLLRARFFSCDTN